MSGGLRLAFAGTPALAATVLGRLLDSNRHRVELVLTQPDRPVGRGRKITPSEVKQCAQQHQLPLLQEKADALDAMRRAQLDLLVVVAFGSLLPPAMLAAPRLGCINLHFSLLPRWRGAAPMQHAILAGDRETGVSLMQMDEGLDTGPIYRQASCIISEQDTCASLSDKLVSLGGTTLLDFLEHCMRGTPTPPEPQDDARACYAPKIGKQQTWLDWQQDAHTLSRQIRALNPAPVARARWGEDILRIWEAVAADTTNPQPGRSSAAPGTLLESGPDDIIVMTGRGQLHIRKLQAAGKRVMSTREFLNGRSWLAPPGGFAA